MEQFFLTLLEISAGTSVVILAVWLFSTPINRTFVARWKYWLWLVLAIRLLIPWNPDFSAAPARVEVNIPEFAISAPAQAPQAQGEERPPSAEPSQVSPSAAPAPVTTVDLLWSLWVLGMTLFAAWHLLSYFHFRRRIFRWSRPVEEDSPLALALRKAAREMGILEKVLLLWNDQLQSPLMLGFFRPVLVLPRRDYGREELDFILRHELTHYRRRDIWYKSLLLAANTLHWFNPVVWLMVRSADQDLEISCDAAVVAGRDQETRRRYSQVILANIRREPMVGSPLSTHFYGGKKMMKERFINILNNKKRRRGGLVFIAVLLCVLLVGGLVACGAQPVESSQEPETESPSQSQSQTEPISPSSSAAGDEEILEEALATVTLENYPHSSQEAIEQFNSYVRSLPMEEALTLMKDEQLVAYMLNPSYWTDQQVEEALAAIPGNYPNASQEALEQFQAYVRSLSADEALALLSSPDQVAPMLEDSYWGIEAEPQGLTAIAANSWNYAPDQSAIPADSSWATQEQLENYQQLVSGLNLSALTNVTVLNLPGSEPQSVPMSQEDAAWIVSQLSGLELAVTEPKNPSTGGALTICLQGPETNVTISYEGEMLVIAQAGQASAMIFDGAACSETMDAIWAMVMGMV